MSYFIHISRFYLQLNPLSVCTNFRFYFSKLATYKSQSLEEIKGKVISDYQKTLEEKWISELRKKSKIIIRDKELKKLKKTYNQS